MTAKNQLSDFDKQSFLISVHHFKDTYWDIKKKLPRTGHEIVSNGHEIHALISDKPVSVEDETLWLRQGEAEDRNQLRAIRRVLWAAAYSATEQFLLHLLPNVRHKERHESQLDPIKDKIEKIGGQTISDLGLCEQWAKFDEIRKVRNLIVHEAGLLLDNSKPIVQKVTGGILDNIWSEPLFPNARTMALVIGEDRFFRDLDFLQAISIRVWDLVLVDDK